MKRRVLITGSSGFLANYLVRQIQQEQDCDIFGISDVDIAVPGITQFAPVDIRDREQVFQRIKEIKPDLVYHLAAITNVGFSWNNQRLTYEVNLIGSLNLLEGLYEQGFEKTRVILMSSAEVYGNNDQLLNESTDVKIDNPYSLSKYAMEKLADILTESRGMDIIKIRPFNFAGPGQDRKFVIADFANQIARIEQGVQAPLIEVGNLSAMRDFSDVRDIARYLAHIADAGSPGLQVNLCSGQTVSIQQILDMLLKLSKSDIEVRIDPTRFRPIDTPVLNGDNSLIKNRYNLVPQYSLRDTLQDTLDYWREQIYD